MNVIDYIRENARRNPDQPAIVCAERDGVRSIGYGALARGFEDAADRLRERDFAPGDRCGLVAKQGSGFIEAALGILAADGCMVPIPDGTRGPALERCIAESHLHHLLHESAEGFDFTSFPDVLPVDGNADREFRALGPAYLRFTSGTTHLRKGVIVGHAAILARLENANHGLAVGPGDAILWLLPMAHHFVVSILLYLRYGATILLPASSLARSVLEFASEQRATLFYASPYHYNLLAKDRSELALERVRLAVSTADGLRAEIATRFFDRFGLPLVQALGIIEVGLPVMNSQNPIAKPQALGRPQPGYEIWLRGEDGRLVGQGEHGEICIRGEGLFDAYLQPWTLAEWIVQPDGFRTGDWGWFDGDGDLHLAGRRANRISLAGMKFFSEEVEAVLDAHPEIARSRVFAKSHAHLGEIPAAEIVPQDPANPPKRADILAHCRDNLETYKIPRELRVVESIALTDTGKVRRWEHNR